MSSNNNRDTSRPMQAEPVNSIELMDVYINEDGQEIDQNSSNQNRLSRKRIIHFDILNNFQVSSF
jgi:hypothetical protein